MLFETPEFKAGGNLFWPDFWTNAWIEPEVYGMFGVEVPWEGNPKHRVTESGQMLVDRCGSPHPPFALARPGPPLPPLSSLPPTHNSKTSFGGWGLGYCRTTS